MRTSDGGLERLMNRKWCRSSRDWGGGGDIHMRYGGASLGSFRRASSSAAHRCSCSFFACASASSFRFCSACADRRALIVRWFGHNISYLSCVDRQHCPGLASPSLLGLCRQSHVAGASSNCLCARARARLCVCRSEGRGLRRSWHRAHPLTRACNRNASPDQRPDRRHTAQWPTRCIGSSAAAAIGRRWGGHATAEQCSLSASICDS